jgi:hypothetical protein
MADLLHTVRFAVKASTCIRVNDRGNFSPRAPDIFDYLSILWPKVPKHYGNGIP